MFFLFDFFLFGRAGKAKRSVEKQLLCRRAFPFNLLFPFLNPEKKQDFRYNHSRRKSILNEFTQ